MSKWLLWLGALVIGSALVATDVDARRLGGGRSVGVQRNVTTPPAQTPARPAQQQQATQGGQQQGQAAQTAPAGNRWLPILGGLAVGGLLGYLFGGNGLLGIVLLALLAIGAVVALRALARRREESAPRPVQFAGLNETARVTPTPAQPAAAPQTNARVPSGFDTAGFLRAAKLNFVKLQVANDMGQLDEIREFTTNEMFEELRKDVSDRSGGKQQTDVLSLNADLLEVSTEKNRHWASVRFSGMVRETPGTSPVGFEEVWNLVKPADGSSGWLLAGIQQMH